MPSGGWAARKCRTEALSWFVDFGLRTEANQHKKKTHSRFRPPMSSVPGNSPPPAHREGDTQRPPPLHNGPMAGKGVILVWKTQGRSHPARSTRRVGAPSGRSPE
jgi:hypothetical protein